MEGRLLLKNARVLFSDQWVHTEQSVLIDKGAVLELQPVAGLATLPGDWEVSARERLVTRGLSASYPEWARKFEVLGLLGDAPDLHAFFLASALRAGICHMSDVPFELMEVSRQLGLSTGPAAPDASLCVSTGEPAHLVVWDFVPPEGPFSAQALLPGFHAAWVVVQGQVRVREGQLLTADFLSLSAKAARKTAALR